MISALVCIGRQGGEKIGKGCKLKHGYQKDLTVQSAEALLYIFSIRKYEPKGYRFLLWGGDLEKVLKVIVVMAAHICKHT